LVEMEMSKISGRETVKANRGSEAISKARFIA
jgi:hypothetical protein